jgi:cytochrome b subunit of formate dehydrogenase
MFQWCLFSFNLIYFYFYFYQAYASYMKGTLLFEQDKNWQTALVNLKNARYT